MPLSKRRRLFTPKKHKPKSNSRDQEEPKDNEVTTARGRLKGALMEMLEPTADESDASSDYTPVKRERNSSNPEQKDDSNDEEDVTNTRKSPQRQSYVLKLFDRSVDLSQFNEDSPLYPICRAWIANQPKANYKDFGSAKKAPESPPAENCVELPGPEGPPISRIPNLIPEQRACSKDNINLNYVCTARMPPAAPTSPEPVRLSSARGAAAGPGAAAGGARGALGARARRVAGARRAGGGALRRRAGRAQQDQRQWPLVNVINRIKLQQLADRRFNYIISRNFVS